MGRPAGDARGGEQAREELLWNISPREHNRCPEVDVGGVRTLGVRLVENFEGDFLCARRCAMELRRFRLCDFAKDLGARVVGPVHTMPEACETLAATVGIVEPFLCLLRRTYLVKHRASGK